MPGPAPKDLAVEHSAAPARMPAALNPRGAGGQPGSVPPAEPGTKLPASSRPRAEDAGASPAGGAAGKPCPPAGSTARSWTIELPAGLKLLSLNGREHWAEKNRRGQALKKAAWVMALNAKIPPLERVSIVVEYQPPDRRHRDADNAGTASGKHCIDGLVAARVIPDDESPRYVTGVRYIIGPIFPEGRLVLYVTEAPAEASAGAA